MGPDQQIVNSRTPELWVSHTASRTVPANDNNDGDHIDRSQLVHPAHAAALVL
jgi:hypothetical protein